MNVPQTWKKCSLSLAAKIGKLALEEKLNELISGAANKVSEFCEIQAGEKSDYMVTVTG